MEQGGKCLVYDLEMIANEISSLPILDKSGRPREFSKSVFGYKNGELYFRGESRSTNGNDVDFKLKKECNGSSCEWLFYDDEKEGGEGWINIKDYFTTSLYEQILRPMETKKTISQTIDDKLRDIYFYTVTEKGKEKINFDLEDKKNIERELDELQQQNKGGDKAFIEAVVRSKGMDKNDDLVVKLGSYPSTSNIDLGLKMKGLGSVLGTQYFSVKNNAGPDTRDFTIVPGDIYKNIDFKKEKEKKDQTISPQQPIVQSKEEPYEEVMKLKEKRGLESLVNSNVVTNNLTKKQKELLEKLRGDGYLFKQPVDESGYIKRRVNSKEFTESFNVWKKRS